MMRFLLSFGLLGFYVVSGFSQESLQQRIEMAHDFDTLYVTGPIKAEAIIVSKPLTLIGVNKPIINGLERGSVVTITADQVTLSGFEVTYSGKTIADEPAGIKIESNFVNITNNELHHVFFGIYVAGGKNITIANNYVHPGKDYALRAGHGITIWNCEESEVFGNTVEDARDGIFLNYTNRISIHDNHVFDCRYGLHSMFSNTVVFRNNYVHDNLLGCALMYSKDLVAVGNTIEWHRRGASSYAFLLKDIEEVEMFDNKIRSNSVGVYAEGVSQKINSKSVIKHNLIEGNDYAFAFHSSISILITDNIIRDNLKDINKLGGHISNTTLWNENGRGNVWSNYRGYDYDNNGIGDQTYIVKSTLDRIAEERNPGRIFLHTPAQRILEGIVDMFPVLQTKILIHDEFPVMTSPSDEERKTLPIFYSVMFFSTLLAVLAIYLLSSYTRRNWI